jgi:O-antigen biosynthesis protein
VKRILIIGKVWPEPNSSAAGTRMMQLIHHFLNDGAELTFISSAKETAFQADLKSLNITCFSFQPNDSAFNAFIEAYSPTSVVFDRFMTEEQFGWRVMDVCPNALRILNTEDLHFLREARHDALKKGEIFDERTLRSEMLLRELAAIYRCDLTLLVSDIEVQLLRETYEIPREKLVHLPFYAADVNREIPSFEEREDFLFIGNFWHEPNWDAVRYLKSTLWPLILKQVPTAKLKIYGAYCSEKVYQLANEKERFLVMGRAEDALEVMLNARVCLAPLRFGAGIKGKLLDAMSCGTPSVTTSIGAEGMSNGAWGGFISDDPETFAARAVKLYNDEAIWEKAQKFGFEIIESRFTKAQFTNTLRASIEELTDLNAHRSKSLISQILQRESHQAARYLSIWIEEKKRNGRGGS